MQRKRFGRLGKGLLAGAALSAVILLFLCALPVVVEHLLLPAVLARAGLTDYRVRVSRFGPGGCALHVATRPGSSPLIAAGTIRAHWSPAFLISRRLDRVVLDGTQFILPSGRREMSSDGSDSDMEWAGLPVVVDSLEIVNSTIALPGSLGGRIVPLSLAASLQPDREGGSGDSLAYRADLDLAGQFFSLDMVVHHGEPGLTANISGEAELARLQDLLSPPPDPAVKVSGKARIEADWSLSFAPLTAEELNVKVMFEKPVVAKAPLMLKETGKGTAVATLTGGRGKYTFAAEGLSSRDVLPAALSLQGEVEMTAEAVRLQGRVVASPVAGGSMRGGLVIGRAPDLLLQYRGALDREGADMVLDLEAGKQSQGFPWTVHIGDQVIRAGAASARVEFEYRSGRPAVHFTAGLAPESRGLEVAFPDGRFSAGRLDLEGSGTAAAAGGFPHAALSGSLRLTDGSVDLAGGKVSLHGMEVELPWSWPGKGGVSGAGRLLIREIRGPEGRLGAFASTLRQQEDRLILDGSLTSGLLDAGSIEVQGEGGKPRDAGSLGQLIFSAAQARINAGYLGEVYPALGSIEGTALVDLEGALQFGRHGAKGVLRADLREGSFRAGDGGLAAEQVRIGVNFPDLPGLRTAPAQELSVGTLRIGGVEIQHIDSRFQFESSGALFIEKIAGQWAGGRIFAGSFRLHSDRRGIETAVFCDRLELAEILNQLGLADAEGEGVVSGRIPVVYKERELFVDDGFLYTTPGRKGLLQVSGSEHLTVGSAGEAPRLSPLHFAGAALRDFEYDWATLNILSEEDNLLLKLQIDGEPREKIPYRFDPQKQIFVPLPRGASGGIDQPVRLDVNFRVPVNEFFRHQEDILPLLRLLKE